MKTDDDFNGNIITQACYLRLQKTIPRGQGNEARRVNARLTGFDYEKSDVYKNICQKFSASVTHSELKSIANILCLHTGLKLDRDATRDNRVLIKWFAENWDTVSQNWDNISLRDDNEKMIDESRENASAGNDNINKDI